MDGASEHWAEERQRERDLRSNVVMSDGKWVFPVRNRETAVAIDIEKQIKEIEDLIINKHGRIVGRLDEIFRFGK